MRHFLFILEIAEHQSAEDVVEQHNDAAGEYFGNNVMESKEMHHDKEQQQIYAAGEGAGTVKGGEFLEDGHGSGGFAVEYPSTVGAVGRQDGEEPRQDIGPVNGYSE